jgi:hypothetical protein
VKDGQILEGEFQGVWTVDPCRLARKDGKVYVPDDLAIRKGNPSVESLYESYSRVGHWWRISEILTPEVVECF